ncbi:MAG: plasmid pRiA4b ORF-3 family protein [Acidobacteriota bacterium]|nr:MAG: plasmid pRiA4b ORF-3 family protein [Acidobacteriota bacterium]
MTVENAYPPAPEDLYPRCIDGAGACPPEDVGGVWGYKEFLEAIHNPDHTNHEQYLAWIGGSFDPERFSVGRVNRLLKRYTKVK